MKHLRQKFLTLKRKLSRSLMFLVFLGIIANLAHDCPTSSKINLTGFSEIYEHSAVTCLATNSHDHGSDHRNHGCALDCSKQHQPALVRSNEDSLTKENLIIAQTKIFTFLSDLFFGSKSKELIVPLRNTTSPTFAIISLLRSIRSVVILV